MDDETAGKDQTGFYNKMLEPAASIPRARECGHRSKIEKPVTILILRDLPPSISDYAAQILSGVLGA